MALLTEYHCHILPGIDDGSDSVETSLQMVEMMKNQGVERICATPHFYAHREKSVAEYLKKRQAALEQIQGQTAVTDIHLGAEVAIEHGISVGIRSRIVLPRAVFDLDADCLRPGLTLLPESDHLQITDRDLIGHILFLTDITFYVVFRHMIHDKPPVRCQTREMIDSCMPGVALVQFKYLISTIALQFIDNDREPGQG